MQKTVTRNQVANRGVPSQQLRPPRTLPQQLIGHRVEDELYQAFPRPIKKRKLTIFPETTDYNSCLWVVAVWIAGGIAALGLGIMDSYVLGFLFVLLFLLPFTCLTLFIALPLLVRESWRMFLLRRYYMRQKDVQRELLRYGVAVPAVVTGIQQQKKSLLKSESYRIDYTYIDTTGTTQSRFVDVRMDALNNFCLSEGKTITLSYDKTFTLLLSRTDDSLVLPYFLVSAFEVVPVKATAVSQRVTAQVAAREALVLRQLARAHEWIEPELLGATPRSVAVPGRFHSAWWYSFAFAALATLCVIYWQPLEQFAKQYGQYSSLFSLAYLAWLFRNTVIPSEQNRQMHLLRDGVAVRAEVCSVNFVRGLSRNTDPPATVIYRYTTTDGSVHQQSISVDRRRLWQLGIIGGASFTVLYHRDQPDVSVPYFALDKAAIVNAFGPKVAPPPTTP